MLVSGLQTSIRGSRLNQVIKAALDAPVFHTMNTRIIFSVESLLLNNLHFQDFFIEFITTNKPTSDSSEFNRFVHVNHPCHDQNVISFMHDKLSFGRMFFDLIYNELMTLIYDLQLPLGITLRLILLSIFLTCRLMQHLGINGSSTLSESQDSNVNCDDQRRDVHLSQL